VPDLWKNITQKRANETYNETIQEHLEIMVDGDSGLDPALLKIKEFNLTSFSSTRMQIRLNFENPDRVSNDGV